MKLRLVLATASMCTLLACGPTDDADVVGSLSGAFTCQMSEAGDSDFDLGEAHYEGDLYHTAYIAGLRTQGCFGRTTMTQLERGWVVQVRLLQHIDWDIAQVLELNLPIEAPDTDRLLEAGDVVEMSGAGGFGSLYWAAEHGDKAETTLFLGTHAGTVTVEEPAEMGPGDWFSGSFDDLDMVEL
ncbi:MAG: hypothetical protein GY898_05920 [Proteobacteria bacterium]|nr:hypothetical protein [Pseudomonadota bacterium]